MSETPALSTRPAGETPTERPRSNHHRYGEVKTRLTNRPRACPDSQNQGRQNRCNGRLLRRGLAVANNFNRLRGALFTALDGTDFPLGVRACRDATDGPNR